MTVAAFQSAAPDGRGWDVRLEHPVAVHAAYRLEDVRPVMDAADRAAREGAWAAVAVAYEAAAAFEPALGQPSHGVPDLPLAWAAICERGIPASQGSPAAGSVQTSTATAPPEPLFVPSIDAATYIGRVETAQRHIRDGDIYQANVTFAMRATSVAPSMAWYERLRQAQQAPYCAQFEIGDYLVLSLSPELFFERRDDRLTLRPMKGTAPRGATPELDAAIAAALVRSDKARAENVMIVDLIRNDVGRVARVGSVQVPALFVAEPYPTLWQLTSTVEARVPRATALADVFAALFPCGSVTGAPKIRAMQILANLESGPRGLYTGAIGVVAPGGDCTFSVAIRTILVHRPTGVATLGVGAGIVSGSTPADEYDECLLKAAFASRP